MKVFLSHAEKDHEVAELVRSSLEEAGFTVWFDQLVSPGANWGLEVGKALEQADAMVVLLSPDAVKSSSVQREIEYALGEKRFKGRLLPVVVRPVRNIPWILKTLDLLEIGSNPKRGSRRVAEALKRSHTPA